MFSTSKRPSSPLISDPLTFSHQLKPHTSFTHQKSKIYKRDSTVTPERLLRTKDLHFRLCSLRHQTFSLPFSSLFYPSSLTLLSWDAYRLRPIIDSYLLDSPTNVDSLLIFCVNRIGSLRRSVARDRVSKVSFLFL